MNPTKPSRIMAGPKPSLTEEQPPAGARARTQLLDAAERLFAQHGIAGVSLREISAAAGQRNNSAVSYHFGSKQLLVDALIADRVGALERLRQAKMAEISDLSVFDAASLLHIMWQPALDIDKGRNGYWFVQFQLAHYVQYGDLHHPMATDPLKYKTSARIMAALEAKFGHISSARFNYRMSLVAMMFWAAVSSHAQATDSLNQRWSSSFALDEVICLAVAALDAPA